MQGALELNGLHRVHQPFDSKKFSAFSSGTYTSQQRSRRERHTARCEAAANTGCSVRNNNELLFAAVETLFKVPPLFNMAVKQARSKIAKRGQQIGLDFDGEVEALKGATDWEAELARIRDPNLQLPAYYTQPFHAYPEGNLCWEAALQVNAAAKSVHAQVMDPEGKVLREDGDLQLRRSYSDNMWRLMQEAGSQPVQDVVDLGCATGLSTLELRHAFPEADILGLDLSPHFLAVGQHLQRQREQSQQSQPERIRFKHAAAEQTGLRDSCVDLVSICLVMHELPRHATQAVIAEAFRILRPGGTFAIMEMNPASEGFQRVFRNPFAYAAFKSTEPWLMEYMSLVLPDSLKAAGFAQVLQAEATPRHLTMVARKEQTLRGN